MPPAESSETPKYNLPPPVEEGNESIDSAAEKLPNSLEKADKPKAPKMAIPDPSNDFQIQDPIVTQTSDDQTRSISTNPQVADDSDLIEKEWVAKAKRIIEATKEDPYNQSKEMTNFKADYMKKRYNKTIKASE